MNKFTKTNIEEISENFDNIRVPLSSKQRENIEKIYPYYGAQSIIDYVDDFLFDGEYILVAEDGENLKSQNNRVCNLVNGKFWVNNHAHIIRAKDGNNTKYLCYYLNLMNFKPFVTGSAQPKLTKDNLNSIPLKIHDVKEQSKIAKVLSDLDAKIEVNNKINQELESMAKTLYDYWFVQFDFPMSEDYAASIGKPELAGKPYKASGGKMVFNKELKREIPEGWEDVKLGDVGKVSMCKRVMKHETSLDEEIPFFKISTFGDEANTFISRDLFELYRDKYSYPKRGDILISAAGTIGKTVIFDGELSYFQDSNIVWIDNDESKIPNCFLYYYYQTEPWVATGGSTIKRLYNENIRSLRTILPNSDILKRFSKIVNPRLEKKHQIEKENQKLSELRDWLLPMLMNGQVCVASADEEKDQKVIYKELNSELLNVAEAQVDYSLFEQQNNNLKARRQAQILTLAIEAHTKRKRNLYRTKGEKLIEVVEKHLALDFGRKAKKMAAGPADFEYLVTTVEPLAKKNDWFVREKKKLTSGGQSNKYIKGSSFNEFFKVAQLENQENIYELERVIDLFTELKTTREAEVVATTYTAWNNLIIRQEKITDNAIVKEAREDWHKKKLEIAQAEFKEAIKWLRKNDLVPKGSGKEVL